MKKKLDYTNDEKRLLAFKVWFDNYVDTLIEKVDGNNIYLFDGSNLYFQIMISKDESCCLIDSDLWDMIHDTFELKIGVLKVTVSKWAEKTYDLKGLHSKKWDKDYEFI